MAPNCPIERFEVILPLFSPLATAALEDPHRLGLPALFFTTAPCVVRSDEQVRRFGQDDSMDNGIDSLNLLRVSGWMDREEFILSGRRM